MFEKRVGVPVDPLPEPHDETDLNSASVYEMKRLEKRSPLPSMSIYLFCYSRNIDNVQDIYVVDPGQILENVFEISNYRYYVGRLKEDASPFSPSGYDYHQAPAAGSGVSPMTVSVDRSGSLRWVIPGSYIKQEYLYFNPIGENSETRQLFVVVQLLFDAKIKNNSYFQDPGLEQFLSGNNLVNTVELYKGDPEVEGNTSIDRSQASIVPLTFHNISLKKFKGDRATPLSGVFFGLYEQDTNAQWL